MISRSSSPSRFSIDSPPSTTGLSVVGPLTPGLNVTPLQSKQNAPKLPSFNDAFSSIDGYVVRTRLLDRLVSVSEWSFGSDYTKLATKDYLWTKYQNQEHREELLKAASSAHTDKLCRTLSTCLEEGYRGRRMRQTCRLFIETVLLAPMNKEQAEKNMKRWLLARHEDRNGVPPWSKAELKMEDQTMTELINCARRIIRQDDNFVASLFAPEPEPQKFLQKVKGFFLGLPE